MIKYHAISCTLILHLILYTIKFGSMPTRSLLLAILMVILSPGASAQDSLAFGDKPRISDGLMGKIYYIPAGTDSLPDFDTLKRKGTIYIKTFNIPVRNWETGFPGLPGRNEWFAIVYTGSFLVKRAGHYNFRILSDDGSKLYIDNQLVINNDGIHGPASKLGDVLLDESNHQIRLEYFQGPKTQIALQLFVSMDNEVEQVFPGNYFTLTTPQEEKTPWLKYILIAAVLIFLLLLLFGLRRKRKRRPKNNGV